MSIPVAIADLNTALADFGAGYLLTTSPGGRVKAVTVEPRIVDGGWSSADRAAARSPTSGPTPW